MILDGDTLEYAARKIEDLYGNEIYKRAWRKAAKHIRTLKGKVLTEQPQKLTDSAKQISSS